jgi:hypothetical protein
MISKQISFKKEKYYNILETIRNLSKIKGYILNESKYGSKYIFTIYDRKYESGMFINMAETFLGNYILPERIMLTVKVFQTDKKINVDIRGDVVMRNWNLINDKPKRRDFIRCVTILEDFVKQLNNLKNSHEKYV